MKHKVGEYEITLVDGTVIDFAHRRDCCEDNFCDFRGSLADTTFEEDMSITKQTLRLEPVQGAGFRINEYFVAAYSVQNGYYCSDVEVYVDGEKAFALECEVQDDYPESVCDIMYN